MLVVDDGVTALAFACNKGAAPCVELLLGVPGIEVDVVDGMHCVWRSVDVCTTDDGWTPLMRSCYSNHSACVELLLATGRIDVNKTQSMQTSNCLVQRLLDAESCDIVQSKAVKLSTAYLK